MKLKKLFPTENILIIGILVSGFLLRIQGVLSGTFAFTYDVGRDLAAAKEIIEKGDVILIGPTTGLHGFFYGPWWYYLLTIPYFLTGGDPRGAVMLIVLSGVITSFFGYLLGVRLGGRSLGLVLAAFIAFSQAMIGATSQLWSPNIAPLLLISILLILEYFSNQKKRTRRKDMIYSLLFGLLIGFSFDAEVVYGTLLAVSLFVVYILFFRKIVVLKQVLLTACGVLLVFSPRIVFEFKNNFLMTKNVQSYLVSGDAAGKVEYTRNFFEQLSNRLFVFFNLWKDTVGGGSNEIGLFLLVISLVFLVFSYKKIKQKEFLFVRITVAILLSFFIGLLFLKEEVWGHYVVGVPLLILLLFSITVFNITKKSTALVIVTTVALSIIMLRPANILQNNTAVLDRDPAVYRNYIAAIDYIYKNADGNSFSYELYTPPVHDNTYKYLFDWYGEKKYGYEPSDKNEQLFYFILEPDYEMPQRRREWLEVRKDNGRIVSEEKLPGGVSVQRRVR